MSLVTELVTKKGDRVGDRKISAITPLSAVRIYQPVLEGKTHAPLLLPSNGEKSPLKTAVLARRADGLAKLRKPLSYVRVHGMSYVDSILTCSTMRSLTHGVASL
jgi:hypothetical protein